MTESESKELLEFPCSFPIKMMGRAIQTSSSRNGTFLSVTVTIDAQSQEQLDNIYNDLSNHEDILVAL
jgi:putative lipoic acid-binding regulatory protein